jgi:hypothetical protein
MAAKLKRKSAGKHGARGARSSNPFAVLDLALPDEELRRLVLHLTTDGNVEPFVRRMVRLMESLDAGRGVSASRAARGDLAALMSAVSRAARRGRREAAYDTAFLAAHYAYQNSLDYLRELLGYLDRFRSRPRAPRA